MDLADQTPLSRRPQGGGYRSKLPAMEGGMAFLHGNECPANSGANFTTATQRPLHSRLFPSDSTTFAEEKPAHQRRRRSA